MLTFMLLCLGAIAVPFVLYPALLWLRAVIARRPVRHAAVTPSVDLVICAHNESSVIGDKVRNALALEYPHDRLRVWIASDGSADTTVAVAQAIARPCN